jgi:hypothetical protein
VVDDLLAIPCLDAPCVQDVQQVAIHLLCLAFEQAGEQTPIEWSGLS